MVVHRSDLLDILVAACRRHGVQLTAAKQVTAVDDPRSARSPPAVRMAPATAPRPSWWQRTGCGRAAQAGREDEPVGSGYVAYRGAVPIDQIGELASGTDVVVDRPGLHLVQYPLRGR